MKASQAILFDLDGTLVETAPDLTGALNHVLQANGRATLPLGEVRDLIGHGARALMTRGFAATGNAMSEAEIERLMPMFLDFYGDNIANHSHVYPNVVVTLQHLRDNGYPMAICTNKPEGLSRQLIAQLGLADYFSAVIGGDTLSVRKPNPRHLTEAVSRLGASRAIMVGDSDTDLNAARAADIPIILVSFGYSSTPVLDLGADAVIDDFAEIPELITRLLA